MQFNTKPTTPILEVMRRDVLLNFCHSVIRPDDQLLKHAMREYAQSLATQTRAQPHKKAA